MIKWAKRLISIPVIIFAIIGFVFIFNPRDISPLSLPCPTACGNDICGFKAIFWKGVSCEISPFSGCNQDCRMRDFKCSAEPEFSEQCIGCINDCLQRFDQTNEQEFQLINECKAKCFQQNN